jgi:serine/threonine protein phosphatase PrpC
MFCTDGVVDKYEDPQTGETDLAELRLDLENGNTPEERLNNLRTLAKFRTTYKHDDDIAIVMARIEK